MGCRWVLAAALILLALPTVEAAVTASGMLSGRAVDAGSGEPIEGVFVALVTEGRTETTDAEGRFTFLDVSPGAHWLEARHAGFFPLTAGPIRVVEGGAASVALPLEPMSLVEEVVVLPSSPREPPDLFPQGLTRGEIDRLPATFDDPLRAMTALPGVAQVNDLRSELRLREGEPGDTLFFLDGVALQNLYHFRGASASAAALSPDAFDRYSIRTSGMGADIGNTISGTVELSPSERGVGGGYLKGALGTMAGRVTTGGPLPDGGSWLAAGRYSSLVLYRELYGLDRASVPDFADLYLRARQPVASRIDLIAGWLGLGSSSEWFSEEGDLRVGIGAESWVAYAGFDAAPRSDLRLRARLARATYGQRVKQGDGDPLRVRDDTSALRVEVGGGEEERAAWRAGIDVTQIDGAIEGAVEPTVSFSSFAARSRWAGGFASWSLEPSLDWRVQLGVRVDRHSRFGWAPLQPRARAAFAPSPKWRIRLSAGRYAQFPRGEEEFLAGGEPLDVSTADELAASVGLTVPDRIEAELTAFVRRLRHLSLETVNRYPDLAEPVGRFGRGRTEGLEIAMSRDRGRFQYRLALTALNAVASREGDESPRGGDRPLSLDLSASYLVSAHWELLGRFQWASGFPYSECVPIGEGEFASGPLNGERLPAYARLDLRASWEKRWTTLRARLYVEVINALGRENVRGRDVTWDPVGRRYVPVQKEMLPLLPAFGIELAWES